MGVYFHNLAYIGSEYEDFCLLGSDTKQVSPLWRRGVKDGRGHA